MDIPKAQRLVKSFDVKYFRDTGKYYSDGHFDLEVAVLKDGTVYMPEAIHHLKTLRDQNSLPGLSGATNDFIIHISHPDGCPALILPTH